jgi:DNA-binding MarR family transcriptional regulator
LKPWTDNYDVEADDWKEPNGHVAQLIDTTTGESMGLFVWEPYKAPVRLDWWSVSQRYLGHAARTIRSSVALRILLVLHERVGFANAAMVSAAAIQEDLGVSSSQFSKAMKTLVDGGAVERVKVPRTSRLAYRLCANFGAKQETLGRPGWLRQKHEEVERMVTEYREGAA